MTFILYSEEGKDETCDLSGAKGLRFTEEEEEVGTFSTALSFDLSYKKSKKFSPLGSFFARSGSIIFQGFSRIAYSTFQV